jgi:dehydrogenase/reductase SDR family protein 4
MIKEKFDLSGKVAIITGSSKGIGEAIARGLAEFGAKVVISSRKQEAVDQVTEQFRADGLEAAAIACHVGKEDDLQNLVNKTLETYGRIDILVNNAAINPVYDPLSKVNAEVFDKIMNVNVRACFLLANLCYPHMKKNGGGSVINIASVEGLRPSNGLGLYSVSKAALIMLTKSQAKEWGRAGIRSNAICPGLIKTKFSAALWQNETTLKQFTQHIPAGRMGTSGEIAGLAAFLASEAGAYCTGETFTADGGYMVAG